MNASLASKLSGGVPAAPELWRRHLWAAASLALLILAAFWGDAVHLVSLWCTSSTFTHCLFVAPLIGWLAWQRAPELAHLTPRAWWPGLVWMAGAALVWVVGEAASVALFRQLGLVMMLQAIVPALLGPQVTRGLAFPLFYAFFLVPVGEELVPPMQRITADLSMAMLRLTGVPAHLSGIFIATPGGLFAVAEACSGVKFLVAMAAMAVLAANLCFSSWKRRAIFLIAALLATVLANGVRAFGTIWLAQHWGVEFAAGADHVIYGWFFFGIVIVLIGWAASPWFDRSPDDPAIDAATLVRFRPSAGAPLAMVGAAMALGVAVPLAIISFAATQVQPLAPLALPALPGWQSEDALASDWSAHFAGADAREEATYSDADGSRVQLTLVGYAAQGEGREVVGYGQGAIAPESDWKWAQGLEPIGPAKVDRIERPGAARDVATLYAIGGTITASGARAKLAMLRARVTGGDQRAFAILISASPNGSASGRDQIAAFVRDAGGVDALARRLTMPR